MARTTLVLDDALVEEAQQRLPTLTKTALIEEALRALIQREAYARIVASKGTIPRAYVVRR